MNDGHLSEQRRAGLALMVGFPLIWQFFGALALLGLGGGWATFLWFGGSVAVGLYVVAFSVVGVACFLDWRDARVQ
jgi:hypothetical protein